MLPVWEINQSHDTGKRGVAMAREPNGSVGMIGMCIEYTGEASFQQNVVDAITPTRN